VELNFSLKRRKTFKDGWLGVIGLVGKAGMVLVMFLGHFEGELEEKLGKAEEI
jgi:hypothetical protein